MTKFLHWAPRLLSLGFVLFVSIFALDVFSEYSGVSVVLPLLMHLVPSFALLAVTLVAWKYEWVGAVSFLGFAVWYVWTAGLDRPWSWYAAIAAPSALVGLLYLADWWQQRQR